MPAKTSKKRTTYHHGDLRAALIAAADAIIAESGLEGFSLRAAAVRAGVSPGAPAHHFGSAKGLLTEVALLAYARLAEAIEAVKPLSDPVAEVRSLTLVFVTFAVTHPGHFRLMFRGDLVNREDPRFAEVGPESGKRLSASVMAYRGYSEVDRTRFEDTADMLCGMAAMHGIAHMVVEGKALHFFPKEQRRDFVKKTLPRVIERMYPDVLPAETRGRTKR